MAYQGVGVPRFFVSDIQFALKKGLTSGNNSAWDATESENVSDTDVNDVSQAGLGALFDLNPTSQQTIKSAFQHIELPITSRRINYVAWLGHNFATSISADDNKVKAFLFDSASDSGASELNDGDNGNINHTGSTKNFAGYDGFSFHLFDEYELLGDYVQITFNSNETNYAESKLGAMAVGKYYDMPHSPDLSLKLSYDYSGIKTVETFGGASLSNAFYTKPPDWGDLGAWELDDGHGINKALSRSGRKIYDLSFSFLDDGDVFGANQSLAKTTMATQIADGTPPASAFDGTPGENGADLDVDNNFNDNLLSDYNFYSQVIHKTQGLPFIFQPDKNDNTNMIIAKFDQAFSFQQTAPGLYSVKCKIREVW